MGSAHRLNTAILVAVLMLEWPYSRATPSDSAVKHDTSQIFAAFQRSRGDLSLPELLIDIDHAVPERTLRRWLSKWVDEGRLIKSGNRRSTRYRMTDASTEPEFEFLKGLSAPRKRALLGQLRDLWTHTSTAVEGNTLTLGDTHFVLEQGLTISGKPIKDHQEVIGHSRAIDILYRSLSTTINKQTVFDLHKAVQADTVIDIYKPNGAWKLEPNGTYTVTRDNRQVYVEYAAPEEVPHLMHEILAALNAERTPQLTLETAPETYVRIHAGVAHTHPFWDGNGRIARLLSNIPLLRAGLPPIVIPAERRQLYVQLLAEYELAVGAIDRRTGVWPKPDLLAEFASFCAECYEATRRLVEEAHGE